MADEPKKTGRPRKWLTPRKRIVANVSAELFDHFQAMATSMGRIQQHCLEEAIRDWLVKYGDASLLK